MRIPSIASHVVHAVNHRRAVGDGRSMGHQAPLALALLAVAALTGGCSKKNDGPRPAALGPSPGAAPAAAPAPNVPATAPAANVAGGGAAADPPAAGGSASSGTIVGKITLASARKADVTPNDVIYLVARRIADNPTARGSLVAVKRFSASSFPVEFTLGAGDMMFKNGAFEGELMLAARIDKDGDPMTRRKGDVFGTVERVKVGAKGVEVKLDQLQKEDESLAGGAPPPAGGMPSGHP